MILNHSNDDRDNDDENQLTEMMLMNTNLCVMHQSTHSAEEPGVDKLPRTLETSRV